MIDGRMGKFKRMVTFLGMPAYNEIEVAERDALFVDKKRGENVRPLSNRP